MLNEAEKQADEILMRGNLKVICDCPIHECKGTHGKFNCRRQICKAILALPRDISMTEDEAVHKAREIWGCEGFAECDDHAGPDGGLRHYVGKQPIVAGAYKAYMGFSWEEAFAVANQ